VYRLYRFNTKLFDHGRLLDAFLDLVTASLRDEIPEYGRELAIDASDLPAYANGQRFLTKNGPAWERGVSAPDASWGHRLSFVCDRRSGG
jgi:hypothetical protein